MTIREDSDWKYVTVCRNKTYISLHPSGGMRCGAILLYRDPVSGKVKCCNGKHHSKTSYVTHINKIGPERVLKMFVWVVNSKWGRISEYGVRTHRHNISLGGILDACNEDIALEAIAKAKGE